MSELEILQEISGKLDTINNNCSQLVAEIDLLQLFFYTYLLFQLITWMRRILNKYKKGQGYNE